MVQNEEKEYFNKNLNLSYVDESLPKPDNALIAKHIVCSLLVYYFVYVILCINPLLKEYINDNTKMILRYCLFGYMIISPLIYFIFRPKSVYYSHNVHIIDYFHNCILNLKHLKIASSVDELKQNLALFKPDYYQKSSLILIFIKMFFGTLMLTYATNDVNILKSRAQYFTELWNQICQIFVTSGFLGLKNVLIQWREFIYFNLIMILYTIDVSVYSFGYLTELWIFKNKIRTVETTLGGLFICLFCYTPLVVARDEILGWNSPENSAAFGDTSSWLTWTLRLISLFFIVIYVSASVALGTKASNLTNRGTVSVFPYNVVRHPAYTSKLLGWFFQFLPTAFVTIAVLKENFWGHVSYVFFACISLMGYAIVYYLRALTEERHLMQDPDYREYQNRVKWQFIPGVF